MISIPFFDVWMRWTVTDAFQGWAPFCLWPKYWCYVFGARRGELLWTLSGVGSLLPLARASGRPRGQSGSWYHSPPLRFTAGGLYTQRAAQGATPFAKSGPWQLLFASALQHDGGRPPESGDRDLRCGQSASQQAKDFAIQLHQ